jgi:hypothetical protein
MRKAPAKRLTVPILATAAGYEEGIRALTIAVANDPVRPAWKPESFLSSLSDGWTNRSRGSMIGLNRSK